MRVNLKQMSLQSSELLCCTAIVIRMKGDCDRSALHDPAQEPMETQGTRTAPTEKTIKVNSGLVWKRHICT